jgi:MFS family permease
MLLGTFLSDKFGRPFPVAVGSVFIIGSTFGQVWSINFVMFCTFKVLVGIKIGMIQLGAAPLVADWCIQKSGSRLRILINTFIYF